jgi:hypothetical protein
VEVFGGCSESTLLGGSISVLAGDTVNSGNGGDLSVMTSQAEANGTPGDVSILGGDGATGGGSVQITGGDAAGGTGGSLELIAGQRKSAGVTLDTNVQFQGVDMDWSASSALELGVIDDINLRAVPSGTSPTGPGEILFSVSAVASGDGGSISMLASSDPNTPGGINVLASRDSGHADGNRQLAISVQPGDGTVGSPGNRACDVYRTGSSGSYDWGVVSLDHPTACTDGLIHLGEPYIPTAVPYQFSSGVRGMTMGTVSMLASTAYSAFDDCDRGSVGTEYCGLDGGRPISRATENRVSHLALAADLVGTVFESGTSPTLYDCDIVVCHWHRDWFTHDSTVEATHCTGKVDWVAVGGTLTKALRLQINYPLTTGSALTGSTNPASTLINVYLVSTGRDGCNNT